MANLKLGVLVIIALIIASSLGFILGGISTVFMYEDTCLDMGGGKNPGGFPICVLPCPNGAELGK